MCPFDGQRDIDAVSFAEAFAAGFGPLHHDRHSPHAGGQAFGQIGQAFADVHQVFLANCLAGFDDLLGDAAFGDVLVGERAGGRFAGAGNVIDHHVRGEQFAVLGNVVAGKDHLHARINRSGGRRRRRGLRHFGFVHRLFDDVSGHEAEDHGHHAEGHCSRTDTLHVKISSPSRLS